LTQNKDIYALHFFSRKSHFLGTLVKVTKNSYHSIDPPASSQDLDLSSDDEAESRGAGGEDADPFASKYNSFGQDIQKIMTKKPEPERPKPAALGQGTRGCPLQSRCADAH
jgi:hypothetical protein